MLHFSFVEQNYKSIFIAQCFFLKKTFFKNIFYSLIGSMPTIHHIVTSISFVGKYFLYLFVNKLSEKSSKRKTFLYLCPLKKKEEY